MDREALQPLLDAVKGRPESFAVNLAVLRSLERAAYAPSSVGHFALASEEYTHFTSPIRRYPDLTVHRLLETYLRGGFQKRRRRTEVPTLDECRELGAHCSCNERRAEAAERELKLVYVLRLLEQHVASEYEGIVTGVTNFGVFVQLPEYLVDGLLRFSDLPDDWWEVDSEAGCVIGQRTRRRLKLGDPVRVMIAAIDLANRELDLTLAEETAGSKPRAAQLPQTGRKRRTRPRRSRSGDTERRRPFVSCPGADFERISTPKSRRTRKH